MSLPLSSTQPAPVARSSGLGEYFTTSELLGLVAGRKLAMLLLVVSGAVLGVLVSLMQPSVWTARVLVQVGQVGVAAPANGTPGPQWISIEGATRAAERVRSGSFARQLLQRLNLAEGEGQPEARLVRESLEVAIPKNTDLLEIRVSGSTPEAARNHAGAVVALLAQAHAHLAEPTLSRMRAQLEHATAQLQRALEQRQTLARSVAEGRDVRPSDRFVASVLLSQLVSANEQEIWELRQQQLALQEQLSPQRTFATGTLTDIEVPNRPTRPNRPLYALGGAGLGLLAALCWALARGPRRA